MCILFSLAAEKNLSLPKSPLTPLQPLCITPVGAISPPLEPHSHLGGIQASSFYKTSGGRNSATCFPHPFVTPAGQRQHAYEVCLYSWAESKRQEDGAAPNLSM